MTYTFKHMTLTQLGQLFGVSSHNVGKWLKSLGLRDEEGLPTKKAHDGRYCKQTLAGDKGTLWLGENIHLESTIFNVNFVDGSGSGDAFAAGLILGLLENKTPWETLTMASAVGAETATTIATPHQAAFCTIS